MSLLTPRSRRSRGDCQAGGLPHRVSRADHAAASRHDMLLSRAPVACCLPAGLDTVPAPPALWRPSRQSEPASPPPRLHSRHPLPCRVCLGLGCARCWAAAQDPTSPQPPALRSACSSLPLCMPRDAGALSSVKTACRLACLHGHNTRCSRAVQLMNIYGSLPLLPAVVRAPGLRGSSEDTHAADAQQAARSTASE